MQFLLPSRAVNTKRRDENDLTRHYSRIKDIKFACEMESERYKAERQKEVRKAEMTMSKKY
jgi:hypothetical protein